MSASASRNHSTAGLPGPAYSSAQPAQPVTSSALEILAIDPALTGSNIFDPAYSLLSSSISEPGLTTGPLISPLESANPFDFSLDPSLSLDTSNLGYIEDMDMDVTEGLTEDMFHVEDWSRYMWSPETGLEHLDMGFPPSGAQ